VNHYTYRRLGLVREEDERDKERRSIREEDERDKERRSMEELLATAVITANPKRETTVLALCLFLSVDNFRFTYLLISM
jgi:hypothetical protein